nr:periplasmic protein TonB [Phenylobacterium sp.]
MPDWLAKPRAEDLEAFYPKAASGKRLEGRATIQCGINAEGLLVDCTAISEEPVGEGFGAAAVGMAAKFKMRPMTKDGQPVAGGIVRIPIRFALPKEEPIPPLAIAMRCYGFAAAKAEQNPASPEAQLRFIGWRLLVEVKSVPQKLRPSELEARLLSMRQEGARQLGRDTAKTDRDMCEGLIKGAPSDLEKLVSEAGG